MLHHRIYSAVGYKRFTDVEVVDGSANTFAPDFVALGSFIEKIEDDNCCDYTTRELYDMLFKLESKRQETASTSSDRTT